MYLLHFESGKGVTNAKHFMKFKDKEELESHLEFYKKYYHSIRNVEIKEVK